MENNIIAIEKISAHQDRDVLPPEIYDLRDKRDANPNSNFQDLAKTEYDTRRAKVPDSTKGDQEIDRPPETFREHPHKRYDPLAPLESSKKHVTVLNQAESSLRQREKRRTVLEGLVTGLKRWNPFFSKVKAKKTTLIRHHVNDEHIGVVERMPRSPTPPPDWMPDREPEPRIVPIAPRRRQGDRPQQQGERSRNEKKRLLKRVKVHQHSESSDSPSDNDSKLSPHPLRRHMRPQQRRSLSPTNREWANTAFLQAQYERAERAERAERSAEAVREARLRAQRYHEQEQLHHARTLRASRAAEGERNARLRAQKYYDEEPLCKRDSMAQHQRLASIASEKPKQPALWKRKTEKDSIVESSAARKFPQPHRLAKSTRRSVILQPHRLPEFTINREKSRINSIALTQSNTPTSDPLHIPSFALRQELDQFQNRVASSDQFDKGKFSL